MLQDNVFEGHEGIWDVAKEEHTLVSTSLSESLPEVEDNTSFDLGILQM